MESPPSSESLLTQAPSKCILLLQRRQKKAIIEPYPSVPHRVGLEELGGVLPLLSAFHLHSDYGLLRSAPRALIWSEGRWSHGAIKVLGCWCWLSRRALVSLSSWLHHRDGQTYLCTCRMLKTREDLEELGIVLSSLDSQSDQEGSLQRTSRVYLWHYCPGRCEGCVGQRGGEHSQTAFPAPQGSARSPCTAQPTSVPGTSQEGPERK